MARRRSKAAVDETDAQDGKRSSHRTLHPLSLQQMPIERFMNLVNQILAGKLAMYERSLKGASATPDLTPPAEE